MRLRREISGGCKDSSRPCRRQRRGSAGWASAGSCSMRHSFPPSLPALQHCALAIVIGVTRILPLFRSRGPSKRTRRRPTSCRAAAFAVTERASCIQRAAHLTQKLSVPPGQRQTTMTLTDADRPISFTDRRPDKHHVTCTRARGHVR